MSRDYSYPLRVAADKFPNRTALVHRGQRWTYAEFDATVDRLAGSFELRGFSGRRVVLLLNNEPLSVIVLLALARAGAVSVPVNPRLLKDEIAYILRDSGADVIVADGAFTGVAGALVESLPGATLLTVNDPAAGGERIEDLVKEPGPSSVRVDPSAMAQIVYTSGTSGFPKGVVRTHDANLWATVNALIGQRRTADDVEVFVLPLFGIAFIFQVMPMILAGGTVVLDGDFDPVRTWDLLEAHRATRVFLAPTMLDSMLEVEDHERRDVSALQVLNTAYEFPERVREAAQARFGPIIAYMYGLSEAQLCVSTPSEFDADPSNAGHAMGMMRVHVRDIDGARLPPDEVGEIVMDGPSLMSGYLGREDATAAALVGGWLYTGDLGFIDEDGRVHVTGRKKEIIKTGGFTVDPVEVENVLLEFPGVKEAAVVGVPDEHWGERTAAFLVASEPVAEDDITAFVRSRVAAFKAPKEIWLVPDLPRTPTGKVQRGRLRAQAQDQTSSTAGERGK